MSVAAAGSGAQLVARGPEVQPRNHEPEGPKQHIAQYLPLAAPVAVLAGIYLTHRLALRREALARQRAAALRFRQAFAPELSKAEADTDCRLDYMGLLRVAHDERHAQAVSDFEPFIPRRRLNAFRQDWNRYRYGENKDGSALAPDAMDMGHGELYFLEYGVEWDHGRPCAPRDNAITRIRKLLSYAQPS